MNRILGTLTWEWPSQGFANLLCFWRGLNSVNFRSGHIDPSPYQYYKLLVNYLAPTSQGQVWAELASPSTQGQGQLTLPGRAECGISQPTPWRGSGCPTLTLLQSTALQQLLELPPASAASQSTAQPLRHPPCVTPPSPASLPTAARCVPAPGLCRDFSAAKRAPFSPNQGNFLIIFPAANELW